MSDIALGFANTVDAEIRMDAKHITGLVEKTGLRQEDIAEKRSIESLKDLLSSMLFHIREGSGCGIMLSDPSIIDAFLQGTEKTITLGGTNIRAAIVISQLGGSSLVHLASVNPETLELLPKNVECVGGDGYHCLYPHIAGQYPAELRIKTGDVDVTAPRANRVIYSADIACAKLKIDQAFFERAIGSKVLVLSGFDLITDGEVLKKCLDDVSRGVEGMPDPKPMIFYEHAYFANPEFGRLAIDAVGKYADVFSMNEDELTDITGERIDLLDAGQVRRAVVKAARLVGVKTVVVHTRHWVLAYGTDAGKYVKAMNGGMAVAAARYAWGESTKETIEKLSGLLRQPAALDFARLIEESDGMIRCSPAFSVPNKNVTTIGLGDSFVGGFAQYYLK